MTEGYLLPHLRRLSSRAVSNGLTIQAKRLWARGEPHLFIQVLYLIYAGEILFLLWGNNHDRKFNENRCCGSDGARPVGRSGL
jgi:hypothetical protein